MPLKKELVDLPVHVVGAGYYLESAVRACPTEPQRSQATSYGTVALESTTARPRCKEPSPSPRHRAIASPACHAPMPQAVSMLP